MWQIYFSQLIEWLCIFLIGQWKKSRDWFMILRTMQRPWKELITIFLALEMKAATGIRHTWRQPWWSALDQGRARESKESTPWSTPAALIHTVDLEPTVHWTKLCQQLFAMPFILLHCFSEMNMNYVSDVCTLCFTMHRLICAFTVNYGNNSD